LEQEKAKLQEWEKYLHDRENEWEESHQQNEKSSKGPVIRNMFHNSDDVSEKTSQDTTNNSSIIWFDQEPSRQTN